MLPANLLAALFLLANAITANVMYTEHQESLQGGVFLGLTCVPEFVGRPGNEEARCPTGFEGIIIYPAGVETPERAINTLVHEQTHFDNRLLGSPNDRFREHEAFAAGCRAAYVKEDCDPMMNPWMK